MPSDWALRKADEWETLVASGKTTKPRESLAQAFDRAFVQGREAALPTILLFVSRKRQGYCVKAVREVAPEGQEETQCIHWYKGAIAEFMCYSSLRSIAGGRRGPRGERENDDQPDQRDSAPGPGEGVLRAPPGAHPPPERIVGQGGPIFLRHADHSPLLPGGAQPQPRVPLQRDGACAHAQARQKRSRRGPYARPGRVIEPPDELRAMARRNAPPRRGGGRVAEQPPQENMNMSEKTNEPKHDTIELLLGRQAEADERRTVRFRGRRIGSQQSNHGQTSDGADRGTTATLYECPVPQPAGRLVPVSPLLGYRVRVENWSRWQGESQYSYLACSHGAECGSQDDDYECGATLLSPQLVSERWPGLARAASIEVAVDLDATS